MSRRTAARWHGEPDVQAELARLSTATLDHLRLRLLGLGDAAADLLGRTVGEDGASVTAAQVSAARTVIAQGMRLHDATVLEERLQRVEAAIEAQQRHPAQRWQR